MSEIVETDAYRAGFIKHVTGVSPAFKVNQGKVLFAFDNTEQIRNALASYPTSKDFNLISIIKQLRGAMHACKDGARNGIGNGDRHETIGSR